MKTLGALLLLLAAATGSAKEAPWLLVEFSDDLPTCVDVSENARCWGTRPELASFEMRSGETLTLEDNAQAGSAWVRFRRLWVPTNEYTNTDSFRISIERTPLGARLMIVDGVEQYLSSLPLDAWTRLEARDGTGELWARVSALP